MNSGVAPILLKRNQAAFATNCTFRGDFLKPRSGYRKIKLTINDPTAILADVIYQGGTYYQPDFGQESLVNMIGGRLLQFLPDTNGGATVYDRTIQQVASTITGNSTTISNQTTLGILTVTNINDASGQAYGSGQNVLNDPANIAYNLQPVTTPAPMTNGTTFSDLQINQTVTTANGTAINWFIADYPTIYWTVIGRGTQTINLSFNTPETVTNSITIPVGTIMRQVHPTPSPAVTVGTLAKAMDVINVGSSGQVVLLAPYAGPLNQMVTIGNGQYLITAASTQTNTTLTGSSSQSKSTGLIIGFDPNPANLLQAWLWQSENYVIGNDGETVPVIFDGVTSRRADTASFNGVTASAFAVPQIGSLVTIQLTSPFTDLIGRFIQVTAPGLYPFQMEVEAVNGSTITASNVTGLAAFEQGAIIPVGASIISLANPTYFGILSTSISNIPAVDSPVTLSFIPNFNGKVGDTIYLTDGVGTITQYEFEVVGIQNGGLSVTVNNVNAPVGLIINAGFPVISETMEPDELPIGRMGAYVQGRNWISLPNGTAFMASDQVGDSSGTEQFGFRDAVLKWSLNTTEFAVPGGAGKINCIVALSAIDASLGQGPLQIGCDNDVFSCAAPSDSTLWPSVTSPILVESAIGFGITGQNAAAVSNGDLLLKSNDGTLHSMQLTDQNFYQWGIYPISREVQRIIQEEDDDLYEYLSSEVAANRLLMGCAPLKGVNGIYSQGFIALDFDVSSSLRGKEPSVYDGAWKGLNILQVITGKFNKQERTFVFHANTETNTIELWEVVEGATFDDQGAGPVVPITWSCETPVLFNNLKNKGEFEYCQLESGELYVSDLIGRGVIKVWYRPDFDPCWYNWHEFSFGEKNLPRLGLGHPKMDDCAATGNRPPNFGRFFQVRIEFTGSFIFKGGLFFVSRQPQPEFAEVLCAPAVIDSQEGES